MKYVYIVTRACTGIKEGSGTPIPNLGVYTSKKEAENHFDAVIKDRKKHGEIIWIRKEKEYLPS